MSDGGSLPELPPPTESKTLNFLVGMLMTSSMYAVFVALFGVTLYMVKTESRGSARFFSLLYILLLFCIYTMNVSSSLSNNAALVLCGLKDGLNLTLCKINAVTTPSSLRRLHLTGSSQTILTTFADGLSIYRAFILWQRNWLIIIPSCLILALSIGLFGWAEAPAALAPANLTFAVFGLSAAVDLVTTSLIIGRLAHYRRSVRSLGSDHQRHYATLMAIFVESSALVSIARILNAILQFTKDGETSWSQAFSNGASAIGPLLIILRITLRIAHDGRSPAEGGGAPQFTTHRTDTSTLRNVIENVIDAPTLEVGDKKGRGSGSSHRGTSMEKDMV